MSDVKERLARLSPEKRLLFEKRLRGEAPAAPRARGIPRRPEPGGPYPLTFEQEHVWVIYQVDPGVAFLHIPAGYRMLGRLDLAALERALNEVVSRHENLRTTFVSEDGRPVPVISPSLTIPLPLIDLGATPESEREAEMIRLLTEVVRKPFDLVRGPLVRAALVRLSEHEHAMAVVMHHLVTDRVSVDVLRRELALLYDAFSRGEPSPLPALPIQYGDYAAWLHERLQGPVLAENLDFWKEKLLGAGTLSLPTDYPRPAVPTYPGKREYWKMPEHLWAGLKALSLEENVTRFVTFLTLFGVLLYRYTRQPDFLIGTHVNTRDRQETQGLIGYFLNTLGLRMDFSGRPTFREMLRRVRQMSLESLAHQEVSIARVLQEFKIKRDANSPIYQVGYIYVNFVKEPAARNLDINISALNLFHQSTPMVDLSFDAFDGDTAGAIAFDYNTTLFSLETTRRMMSQYLTLLESAVADPDRYVGELRLLTEGEQRQILGEWNATAAEYAEAGLCLHRLFERQAGRTPDATALVCGEERMTYAELDGRAERVARRLRARGVGPEVPVGVMLERGVGMVVALLGVLKAGGAYVPLDPAYPAERLSFMLEDAGARVLLGERAAAERFGLGGLTVLEVEAEEEEGTTAADADDEARVDAGVGPDNLAYVIYTSGSTGRPKGVMIAHRAVVNFLATMRREPGLAEGDILLAVTTLSFDIAGLELYLPLTTGARVHVASREVAADGALLARELERSGATVMQATPATWRMLLEAGWPGDPRLKILCGGEALPRELADRLLARCASLWNMYGPTETTIWSAAHRVEASNRQVPVGRPVANTQFYILDENLRPVPVGVPGELYIGGEGLARGYLKRPALTAERFVPDPFARAGGARLYRTGDLARYLPDGNVDFLGRVDQQVKVRGFRIELGEVEAVLAQHPVVREAVAHAQASQASGDSRLVAYVVPTLGAAVNIGELRAYLQERLPEYMVPSVFVTLDELPLTVSGKVDRRALPEAEVTRAAVESAYQAPRTEVEEVLSEIWKQVLGVAQPVGVYDNFFELGGHSLLAAQVASRIHAAFEVEISLRDCFDKPTIARLGGLVEELLVADIDRLSDEEAREESSRN